MSSLLIKRDLLVSREEAQSLCFNFSRHTPLWHFQLPLSSPPGTSYQCHCRVISLWLQSLAAKRLFLLPLGQHFPKPGWGLSLFMSPHLMHISLLASTGNLLVESHFSLPGVLALQALLLVSLPSVPALSFPSSTFVISSVTSTPGHGQAAFPKSRLVFSNSFFCCLDL